MLIIGADHGGFELKEIIKKYLDEKNIKYFDFGALENDPLDDFSDIAIPLAKKVADKEYERGILICGSGAGVCMAANRVKGVRAVNCFNTELAKLAREHNDANILCMGGRFVDKDTAVQIIDTWLNTEFLGGKYDNRNKKLDFID